MYPQYLQAMAFRPVIEGKSCILADQSGSGKTLAYLTPLIQRIREEEIQGLSMASSQSPRILILVPTAELAAQVGCNFTESHSCAMLSFHLGLSVPLALNFN